MPLISGAVQRQRHHNKDEQAVDTRAKGNAQGSEGHDPPEKKEGRVRHFIQMRNPLWARQMRPTRQPPQCASPAKKEKPP